MILFLDDSPVRTKRFRHSVPSAFCAEDAKGMIALLEKLDGPARYVFLDHDLGGETYCDSSLPNTGMEVVRWIVSHKPPIETIIVHSLNYPAGSEMKNKLKDAGYSVQYVPFHQINFDAIA